MQSKTTALIMHGVLINWKEKKKSTKLIRISEIGFTGKKKYFIEINKWTTLFARTKSAQLN